MSPEAAPKAHLSHLNRADGSASFSHEGYTIVGAVNGPIEAQRRDELPEEAAVDVVVRPLTGVGDPRERYLESILQATLRQVILIHNHPRTLIQIALQITATPESESSASNHGQSSTVLPLLPPLLQTSILALLSASIALSGTVTSTLIAIDQSGSCAAHLTPKDLQKAASIHVFAFSADGDLLLVESEGDFGLHAWDRAFDLARSICCEDITVDKAHKAVRRPETMDGFLRETLNHKVAEDQRWKEAHEGDL